MNFPLYLSRSLPISYLGVVIIYVYAKCEMPNGKYICLHMIVWNVWQVIGFLCLRQNLLAFYCIFFCILPQGNLPELMSPNELPSHSLSIPWNFSHNFSLCFPQLRKNFHWLHCQKWPIRIRIVILNATDMKNKIRNLMPRLTFVFLWSTQSQQYM